MITQPHSKDISFIVFISCFPDTSKDDTSAQESANKNIQETEFAQVSQDMSELVYHLNSIQNDISELAGRPISLTKLDDN